MIKVEMQSGFEIFTLFESEPLEGLDYRTGYITIEEEAALTAFIDAQPWSLELLRRRQWYGWAYGDSLLGRPDEYKPQPMPDCFSVVGRRLFADGHLDGVPDRALVNEYFPGQGIGAHKDRDAGHIAAVAIISLGAAVMMDFTRSGYPTRSYYLRPRSLVTMRGEARHQWLHGIAGRKSDRVGGVVMPRGRRLSMTFRYVDKDDKVV